MTEYQPEAAPADYNKLPAQSLREVISKCFISNEDVRTAIAPHETVQILAGEYVNPDGELFTLLLFDVQSEAHHDEVIHDITIRVYDRQADTTLHVALSGEGYMYPLFSTETLDFLAFAVKEMITNHEETEIIATALAYPDEEWDEEPT